jgi:hypothetical protein
LSTRQGAARQVASAGAYDRVSSARDDSTRYLCATAHLKPEWREQVLADWLPRRSTATGPPFGVNMAAVVTHCLWARRRELIMCALAWLWLLGVAVSVLRLNLDLLLFTVLGGLATAVRYDLVVRKTLVSRLQRASFDAALPVPGLSVRQQEKVDSISARQLDNVIVYRRERRFSPFVGSGHALGSWSVTVDVRKAKDGPGAAGTVTPFHTTDLYRHVRDALLDLDIPELRIDDRLYVDGASIRDDPRLVPDHLGPPITKADGSLVESFVDDQTGDVRHYQCVQVISWREELNLSIFVRFCQLGSNLHAEANYTLLTPVDESYRSVDSLRPLRGWHVLLYAIRAPRLAVRTWYDAIRTGWSLPRRVQRLAVARRRERRRARTDPTFDYGAETSTRELAASGNYRLHFQRQDKQMYVKMVEARILNCVTAYLDGKNVDTSVLTKRATMIQNSGIIMLGQSQLHAENVAAGDATISTQAPGAPASPATPEQDTEE